LIESVNRAFALRQEIDRRLASDSTSADAAPLRALRDTLLAHGKRMVPLFYGHNQYAEPYTATILDEIDRLGYGDSNTGPNAVEQRGAEAVTAAAHDAVKRLDAVVQAQLAAVNARLQTKGQPPLSY
jgi:hypothetical protein